MQVSVERNLSSTINTQKRCLYVDVWTESQSKQALSNM